MTLVTTADTALIPISRQVSGWYGQGCSHPGARGGRSPPEKNFAPPPPDETRPLALKHVNKRKILKTKS